MKKYLKSGIHNKCDFEHFPPFSKIKKSKNQLLSAIKVEKIADNKAQFELKIAQLHVLHRKIIKITLIIGPNNRKNTR